MRRFWIICCFLVTCTGTMLAQRSYPTTIQGTADFAVGESARLVTFDDMVSYPLTVISTDEIDRHGRFTLTCNIQQPTLVQLAIRTSRAEFYIEPGRTYDLSIDMDPELFNLLDPMSYGGFLQIKNNDTTLTEDINLKINYFERTLDYAIDRFAPNIVGDLSRAQFDSILQFVSNRVPIQYSPTNFYKSYIYYTMGSLERIIQLKRPDSLYLKYLDNEYVLYDNPAYMNFLYDFYNEYLLTSPRINPTELRKSINEDGTYLSLFNTLGQDEFLVNERLRELVIIDNLAVLYNVKQFNKKNILTILREIALTSHFYEHKKIAENVIRDLTDFTSISALDFDKMKTVQGAKFDLSDFKGKWVYVQLFNVSCEDCIREMMIVKELQKKYEDKIAFVSMSLDFNYGQFIQFKERFPQFDWTFVHFNGRYDWIDNMEVTTLPDNLLIAPDGTLAKRYAPDITTKLSQFLAQLFSDGEEDPDLPLNRNNRP